MYKRMYGLPKYQKSGSFLLPNSSEKEVSESEVLVRSASTTYAALNTAPNSVPRATLNATPNVASDAAPNVGSDAAPNVASDAAPNVASDAAPNVGSDAAPNVASDAAPNAPPNPPVSYSVRPRRWPTPSERDSELWEGLLGEESLEKLKEIREERERAKPPPPPTLDKEALEEVKLECLLVDDIELHVKENAEAHHTDLYECTDRDDDPQLVVRRGQEFNLTFSFKRPWSSKGDDMHLVFRLGEEPNPHKDTYVEMKLEEGNDTGYMTGKGRKWGARILTQSDNFLTVGVYPPPDCIVGEWQYAVRTTKVKDEEVKEYECVGSEEVIILLNPWCEDDQVHMENTEELAEYINNQFGVVFVGNYSDISTRPWFYDQFMENVLTDSLDLLRLANCSDVSCNMGDPVYISRALSRILNNFDDEGVLVGRWDGEYSDGKRPTSWMGSYPILEEFRKSKKPVKYGQCWVFSHLLTTVARALGLPCRSVTNFSSAHDTDLTMTIDKYVDEEGEEVEYKNHDSVWNFHVWNEVWIKRPDLDRLTGSTGKYDGWHVVDATPQELSDSVFQCGPSPLAAIKEGEIHIGYDTKFIFAEVNAEYCNWEDGLPPVLLNKNSTRVGRKISTKIPNGKGGLRLADLRLDITHLYKYAEGSGAEREVVMKATQEGKYGDLLFENNTDVEVVIDELEQRPQVGQDVTVKVSVKNTSSETRTLSLSTSVRPINYWGGVRGKERIARKLFEEEPVEAGQTKTYELTVMWDDILRLCDDALSMKIMAMCRVQGFKHPVFESDELVIKPPGISCKGPDAVVDAGDSVDVEITMRNPLNDKALTGCKLNIQGGFKMEDARFTRFYGCYIAEIDDLQPGEVRTAKVKVITNLLPRKSDEREINVGLETRELPDFVGSWHIDVKH